MIARLLALWMLLGAAAVAPAVAQAPPIPQVEPLLEQPMKVPSQVPGPFGTRTYQLDALVIRPPVAGRLPLVVITHGTPRDAADRRKVQINSLARIGRDFARRGWVAVAVVRRGHGASEGEYEEGMTCANPDYVRSGRMAIHDLDSTVRHLAAQPYVDGSRVLGVGQSTGGFAWLATASKPPPGLVGVINFAGGHGSLRPYENCSESQMLLAMRTFGETARVPSLWIYAENDTYVVPDFARRMHAAFTGAGGRAELKLVPPFESDGHALLYRADGAQLWTPLVDGFLRQHGWPTWSPAALPPDLQPAQRQGYERYLAASAEKAFALAPDGRFGWFSSQATLDDAKQKALERCEAGVRKCRIAAVNFSPVTPSTSR